MNRRLNDITHLRLLRSHSLDDDVITVLEALGRAIAAGSPVKAAFFAKSAARMVQRQGVLS